MISMLNSSCRGHKVGTQSSWCPPRAEPSSRLKNISCDIWKIFYQDWWCKHHLWSFLSKLKTQTKFKQWLELLSTNSLGRAPTPPLKIKFWRKKTSCFSKFEQCSNCGQNSVLSSYKMYLNCLHMCSVNGGLNISVVGRNLLLRNIFDIKTVCLSLMVCLTLHVSQQLLSILIFQ